MSEEIADWGSISLYGIYFESDETAIKQESNPTIEEIAKLLAAAPELKLRVVGFIFQATQPSSASLTPLPKSQHEQLAIERARLRYQIPAAANIDQHGHLKPGYYLQLDMIDPHIEGEIVAETEEILWFLGVDITYEFSGKKWTVPGR